MSVSEYRVAVCRYYVRNISDVCVSLKIKLKISKFGLVSECFRVKCTDRV